MITHDYDGEVWVRTWLQGVPISDADTWNRFVHLYGRARYAKCAEILAAYAERYIAMGTAMDSAADVCNGLRATDAVCGNHSPMNILDGPEYAGEMPKVKGMPQAWLKLVAPPAEPRQSVDSFYGRQETEE